MKIFSQCIQTLKEQRGAYMVLVALLLPLLFGFAGLAMDIGNYQSHTAKLQNAADAAALAGAAVYAGNNEQESAHPLADAAAEKYLKANLGTDEFKALTNTGDTIRYQVKTADDVSYYRVWIEENLNTTLIRLIGAPKFTYPQGEAIATIPVTKRADAVTFDNLISFSGHMWGSFDENNKNQIHTTFDGNIYCYSNYEHCNYMFYKGDARNLNKGDADKDKKYYSYTKYDTLKNHDTLTNKADTALKNLFTTVVRVDLYDQNCKLPGSNSTSNYYYLHSDSSRNLTLDLNNFSSDTNQPVYIYIDKNVKSIKINLQDDITHPVIICYTGSNRNHWWDLDWFDRWDSNIEFNGNGHNFHGSIYVPYASTHLNFEKGTFTGSITTHHLNLSSNHGSFVFEKFGIPGSGSGSSSTSGSKTVDLKLVSVPGLTWNTSDT